MILFLPYVAMLKVVCEEFVETKPIALLLGSQNDDEKGDSGIFKRKWFKKLQARFSKFHAAPKKTQLTKRQIKK